MLRASVAALVSVTMFAGAQVAWAQNANVREKEIECFVTACDEAAGAAQDVAESASEDDECLNSGVCPVGETRGFELSNGALATRPNKAPAARAAPSRSAAARYGSGSSSKLAAAKVGKLALPAGRRSLDMRLSFELGSARLTPDARLQADLFARKLKDLPATSRDFVIEGHTDSIGSAASNRQLSRERAQAVVDYLVGQGVPANRLKAVGYGFDHPRDGLRASDPSNRRVEIVRY